ncbi:hypothetical protein TUM18999_59120 [Pseudomonas tohonis]|uniref:Uncharacterized protein n=1 Tax=Pseudomonas tohonis TaxID=2725477 RepID=A0A6J4EGX7_9PSED|nr:hypothetical protein [Pseudomonas tohonis]BCG27721.1 hypothetical protein TUM18999_59120 [Pseudomonas tohonis]GJN54148.1 hypothetical protein TUM20286_39000 [Pseudomonas tohonis]
MKRSKRELVVCLLLCCFAGYGGAENHLSLSLCGDDEMVYISCAIKARGDSDFVGNVASICAKGNGGPDAGYVQYRYGKSMRDVEITYPLNKIPPRGIFKIYSVTDAARSNSYTVKELLQFKVGQYVYSFEGGGIAGYRLVVRKGVEEVFNESCNEPGHAYISDQAYEGLEKEVSD